MQTHENLRQWEIALKKQAPVPVKQALYKSMHDPNPQLVNSSFGPVKERSRIHSMTIAHNNKIKRKPPIPKREDGPVRLPKSNKDFITANAIENILASPHVVSKQEPIKRSKGKIPKYLSRVKREICKEKEEVRRVLEEEREREYKLKGITVEQPMPEVERRSLVKKLKIKWDEFNREYQKQAHVVNLDTVGKIARKEYLETSMDKVEQAIQRLERGPMTVLKTYKADSPL